MAIEIVPQQKVKKRPKISIVDILYYFVSLALVVIFLSYFGLIFLYQSSEARLEKLVVEIREKETKEARDLEERVLDAKEKIDTFVALLKDHGQASNLFSLLSQISHKRVFFNEFNLNLEENEAVLSAKTEGFRSMGEQMLILRSEKMVKEAVLQKTGIGKEGDIEFVVKVDFDPFLFKYK